MHSPVSIVGMSSSFHPNLIISIKQITDSQNIPHVKGDPFEVPPLTRRAPGLIHTLRASIFLTNHPIRCNCDL